MITPSRRSLITGLIAFTASAPAIVRAGSLMPVKNFVEPTAEELYVLFHARLAYTFVQHFDEGVLWELK